MLVKREIEELVKSRLRDEVPCYCKTDVVHVDRLPNCVCVNYVASAVSNRRADATLLQLSFQPGGGVAWIGQLRVATAFRFRGLGRRLVRAAERVARALNAETVNVFPLTSARCFWERAGYRPHDRMARVLTKRLNERA